MQTQYIVTIEEGRKAQVKVKAYAQDDAVAYIYAGTMQEAQDLMQQTERQMLDAMKAWTPEPEETAEDPGQTEHYRYVSVSVEEAERQQAAHEATANGARFAKGLQNAHSFTSKHDSYGISPLDLHYLAMRTITHDIYSTIYDTYCYAFRRGYNRAQKAQKGKTC